MTRPIYNLLTTLLLSLPTTISSLAFQWPPSINPTSTLTTTSTPPKNCHILILPGFGNASEDYTMPRSLVPSLLNRGWDESQISVLPVERSDWLQVFVKGLFDLEFWLGNAAPTNPSFGWYLNRISEELERIEGETTTMKKGEEEAGVEDCKVILVGHSAGGWLARAAVGFCASSSEENSSLSLKPIDLDKILGIVTLGAPNASPPEEGMDMTRGALRITNEQFPGAFFAPSLFYVTVIGNAITGKKQQRKTPWEPTTVDGFAYQSYEAVCGEGSTIGDGVVPAISAHVDDAIQLELDGVFHSINAPEQWYGSDDIIDQWLNVVMERITNNDISNDKQDISIWDRLKQQSLFVK